MLEAWSWSHHHWKKKPIWQLWEKNNLNTAAAIHVTSLQEMHSVRARGITAPVAIIPIGIDIPDLSCIPKHPASGSKKTLLFLSRIHPVKGLENLIHAWQQVKHPDWQVIIAGPGDAAYIAELNNLVQKLGLTDYFIFKEALYGDDKWSLMASADVFVLPSFNENFGLVIAEALACHVPVITTTATPWEGLLTHDCGWWVEVGVEPLIKALNEVTQLTTEQLKSKGKNCRVFVENEFNWQESTLKMKSLYEWAAHKTDKPIFVYL
jgi:glycosyltransferase involved in cell wall biosynthesis